MFVIHGTSYENCISILKNKKINHISESGMLSNESPNQIFMSLIYKNIKNQRENMPFWGGYAFVFSPEILKKYPGIDSKLVDQILIDDNPQRKAEVLATLDEAFTMMKKGMSDDEILTTFKKTPRTKQAGGGLAYLMGL